VVIRAPHHQQALETWSGEGRPIPTDDDARAAPRLQECMRRGRHSGSHHRGDDGPRQSPVVVNERLRHRCGRSGRSQGAEGPRQGGGRLGSALAGAHLPRERSHARLVLRNLAAGHQPRLDRSACDVSTTAVPDDREHSVVQEARREVAAAPEERRELCGGHEGCWLSCGCVHDENVGPNSRPSHREVNSNTVAAPERRKRD
jgi:hypothetical protein